MSIGQTCASMKMYFSFEKGSEDLLLKNFIHSVHVTCDQSFFLKSDVTEWMKKSFDIGRHDDYYIVYGLQKKINTLMLFCTAL